VHTPWAGAGHYAIFMKQAIAPMYECRNDIDIFADLARRVGIQAYNDKTEIEWLRELTRDAIDDFDTFMDKGLARLPAPEDAVAFRLVLDSGALQRGDYELSIDVMKENQFWLVEKGTTPMVIPVVIA